MTRRPVRIPRQRARRILRFPMLLALASLAGLVIGLTGEGWRDGLAAALLALPLIILVMAWRRRA